MSEVKNKSKGRPTNKEREAMRAKRTYSHVSDPIFNEFLYSVLYEATYEEKRGLKGKYLKAVMRSKSAKDFIQTATEDEKNYILAHFGVKYFRVFVKEDTLNRERLSEILKKFDGLKKVESFKDISNAKIFVSSDKTFNRLLGIMAQSFHSPAYYLNQEYVKAGYHIQKWPKLNLNERDMGVREVLETTANIAKLLLAGSLRLNVSPGLTGLAYHEMQILLYFYCHWNIYVSREAVGEYLAAMIGGKQITNSIRVIHQLGYIEEPMRLNGSYTITGTGIRLCDNFLKDVMTTLKF